MSVSLELLKTFCALHELKSYTRTADKLCKSQPTISNRIKSLEDKIGFQLFMRNNPNLGLTRDGQALYAHASQILSEYQKLDQLVSNSGHQRMRIGMSTSIEYACSQCLTSELTKQNEKLSVALISQSVDDLLQSMQRGAIDAAYICTKKKNLSGSVKSWPFQVRWVVDANVDPDHFLKNEQIPIILWSEEWHSKDEMHLFLQKNNLSFRVCFEANNYSSYLHAIHSQCGFGYLGDIFCQTHGKLERLKFITDGLPEFGSFYIHKIQKGDITSHERSILNRIDGHIDALTASQTASQKPSKPFPYMI